MNGEYVRGIYNNKGRKKQYANGLPQVTRKCLAKRMISKLKAEEYA